MSDLDKLREKAQAAPRKNWRLRKSLHGPKYAWVSWGDEAEGLGTADLDVPAARYIAAADPTTVLALIDRLQRVETALDDALAANCKGLGTGVSTILVAAGAKASAYDVAAMRCDKCGQKLASDEDDGEPYCLNCETCSRCQGIHHMEDRCQDATEALSQLATATEALADIVQHGGWPDGLYHRRAATILADLSTAAYKALTAALQERAE